MRPSRPARIATPSTARTRAVVARVVARATPRSEREGSSRPDLAQLVQANPVAGRCVIAMFDLHEALRYVVENDGSDLHVKVPARPMARFRGHLEPLPQYPEALTPAETERVLRQMLAEHSDKMAAFDSDNEIDFSYTVPDLARFRVNAFRQRGSVSIVARVIPFTVRTIEELGLPSVIETVADEERGLILLTGTTGSGKSTTLAAIISQINETKARHIVTIEDPIEYLHP